jgi:biopolymer transport protein ExbD
MLDFSTEREPLTTFNLAGVADVVLLLLIFFLLTSNFVPRMGIQVNLPQAGASAPAEEQFVTVSITDEGTFFVGQREVGTENLRAALRTAKKDRTGLLLRADEQATVQQFAAVATAAQALRLRIVMATRQQQQPEP